MVSELWTKFLICLKHRKMSGISSKYIDSNQTGSRVISVSRIGLNEMKSGSREVIIEADRRYRDRDLGIIISNFVIHSRQTTECKLLIIEADFSGLGRWPLQNPTSKILGGDELSSRK